MTRKTRKNAKAEDKTAPGAVEQETIKPHSDDAGTSVPFASLFRSSPLNDFLYPFKKAPNQWVARYIVIVFAIIIRCAVGLGPFSGENTPPMHGDFEAQRHWMEITTHLPISQWYFYDLQYWGLDYPPLTAFHSALCGWIGALFDPAWFALDASRGAESSDLKSYMRITALASELLCYTPAVMMYVRWMGRNYTKASSIDQTTIAAAIFFQPALIIIDHGHFQYNSVMLGLALLAIDNLLVDNYPLAALFFVGALAFKQMALYYAPVFFFYMLAKCVRPRINLLRFLGIAITTVVSVATVFFPFVVAGGSSQVVQIIHRMFPFARGLFEDKVANFWCASNVVVKYHTLFTSSQLRNMSLALTILGISPSCIAIFYAPFKRLFTWALAACSLAFYLFSFQVHEKSILLPWMPVTLLLNEIEPNCISMVCWFLNIALFSMWPLLKRDGLSLQYFLLGILSNWLMGNLSWIRMYACRVLPFLSQRPLATPVLPHSFLWKLVIVGSYLSAAVLQILDIVMSPPANLPDLWVVGNVLVSFASFALFFLWLNYKVLSIACLPKLKRS